MDGHRRAARQFREPARSKRAHAVLESGKSRGKIVLEGC
jgi:hypothetical protein